MSALTRPDYHSDEPSRYAPKWIREGHLRQTEPFGRLPRAVQFGPAEGPSDDGVVSWPQERRFDDHPESMPERQDPAFEGDVAIRQMREARAFEPQDVAEPRWNERPKFSLSMLMRATAAIAVAMLGALVYVGAIPLKVPDVVQNAVASMRQTTGVGSEVRPAAPERSAKIAGRVGEAPASSERPVTAVVPETPAAGTSDNARAVKTVTVAPWPVTASAQPPAAAPAAPVVAPAEPAAPAAPAMVTRRLDPEEIDALIQRGEAFILQGDFAAARLMLRRAAEAGSARAAVTLGATYDPVMLRKVGVVGFKADPSLAREWYERAVALGSPDASARIAELGNK